MSRNSVQQFSTTAASNTDVAGVSIAVGWPPGNVGSAERALCAMLAAFSIPTAITLGSTTVTLTAAQASQLFLPFKGTPGGTCTVTLPNQLMEGFAQNASASPVVLTTGAGTTITLNNDSRWYLYAVDGSGNVTAPALAALFTAPSAVTMSSTSVSLTTAQASQLFIQLTGSPGGTVTVTFPNTPFQGFIQNTSGNSAILTTGAGSTVALNNDSAWYLYNIDGSGNVTYPIQSTGGAVSNNSAGAGQVGEYISAVVSSASPHSLSASTATNVTSISLTPGDWDVSGNAGFSSGGGSANIAEAWISTVSATVPTAPNNGAMHIVDITGGFPGWLMPTGTARISLNVTTTVYLGIYAQIAGGSGYTCYGFIGARRAR